jgi:hypothetical protein
MGCEAIVLLKKFIINKAIIINNRQIVTNLFQKSSRCISRGGGTYFDLYETLYLAAFG